MRQILFHIPLSLLHPSLPDLPVYGYGTMLFLAFVSCSWLAARLARREGVPVSLIPDLALTIFLTGIIGARIFYVAQEWEGFTHWYEWQSIFDAEFWQMVGKMVALWDGGLIFYGSAFGAALGYAFFYSRVLRPAGVSSLKICDIVAPCVALGLALGRIGCLFTGCCFGNAACPPSPAIHFPLASGPSSMMIKKGLQTPAGFVLDRDSTRVAAVEPYSPAAVAGLKRGDIVLALNGKSLKWLPAQSRFEVNQVLTMALLNPPPGESGDIELTVLRGDETISLPAFRAASIGVHPTQIYETISMVLLTFFLLSYYRFKTHDGAVMVFLMLAYGMHRFLNETLRIDNQVVAFGMTLSQNVSVLVLLAGVALAVFVFRGPRLTRRPPPSDEPASPLLHSTLVGKMDTVVDLPTKPAT